MKELTPKDVDAHNEQQRAAHFMMGLQRDSLEVGAIPNPHVKRHPGRRKVIAVVVNWMFSQGLPRGWGK